MEEEEEEEEEEEATKAYYSAIHLKKLRKITKEPLDSRCPNRGPTKRSLPEYNSAGLPLY
jgi:hypothetical protein